MAIEWRKEPILDSVQLPGIDTKYWVADSEAREKIEALIGATRFMGVTTTQLEDGDTTNPIMIDDKSYTAQTGDIVIYTPLTGPSLEFIWDGSKWQLLGGQAIENLGALAYKNSASGSYTPEGSINLTSSTTEVISSVSRGTLGIDLTLSSYSDGYDFSVVTIEGSIPLSSEGHTVVTGLTSSTLSLYSYEIAFKPSTTWDVVTNIATRETSVVYELTSGSLPTISNQSTLTATMGTGSSSTTLIFNLSDIGFSAGEFPDTRTTTVNEVYSTEGMNLTVSSKLASNYTIYTNYSTENLDIPTVGEFSADIYYSANITGQLETSTADVVTGLSATFSGTTSTITVS